MLSMTSEKIGSLLLFCVACGNPPAVQTVPPLANSAMPATAAPSAVGSASPARTAVVAVVTLDDAKKVADEHAMLLATLASELEAAAGDAAKIEAAQAQHKPRVAVLEKKGVDIKARLSPADQKAFTDYMTGKAAPLLKRIMRALKTTANK